MTFRLLQFGDNINSAATNNLGYVFGWNYSSADWLSFCLAGIRGYRVNNTVDWGGGGELEVGTVGESINWNNLSRGQSGYRHKKPKNICALRILILLQGISS